MDHAAVFGNVFQVPAAKELPGFDGARLPEGAAVDTHFAMRSIHPVSGKNDPTVGLPFKPITGVQGFHYLSVARLHVGQIYLGQSQRTMGLQECFPIRTRCSVIIGSFAFHHGIILRRFRPMERARVPLSAEPEAGRIAGLGHPSDFGMNRANSTVILSGPPAALACATNHSAPSARVALHNAFS